jgi:hypothetical protein
MARIEGNIQQMGQRLNHFSQDLADIRADLRDLRHTTLMILIAMWVTIIGFLIGILMKIYSLPHNSV